MWMSFVLVKDMVYIAVFIWQYFPDLQWGQPLCTMCPQCWGPASCPGRVCAQAVIAGTALCRAWLLGHIAAHSSLLTRVGRLLGQGYTFMEPLCLSPENMIKTSLPGVFVVTESMGQQREARVEGNKQQQCEAARLNLPGTAIWLFKYYCQIISCWWARGWGWRRHELRERNGWQPFLGAGGYTMCSAPLLPTGKGCPSFAAIVWCN